MLNIPCRGGFKLGVTKRPPDRYPSATEVSYRMANGFVVTSDHDRGGWAGVPGQFRQPNGPLPPAWEALYLSLIHI